MTEDLELAVVRTSPIPKTAAVETTIGRYMQEIQGMVFMAKQYPRDPYAAWQRIKEACSRKSLAEVAHTNTREATRRCRGRLSGSLRSSLSAGGT